MKITETFETNSRYAGINADKSDAAKVSDTTMPPWKTTVRAMSTLNFYMLLLIKLIGKTKHLHILYAFHHNVILVFFVSF